MGGPRAPDHHAAAPVWCVAVRCGQDREAKVCTRSAGRAIQAGQSSGHILRRCEGRVLAPQLTDKAGNGGIQVVVANSRIPVLSEAAEEDLDALALPVVGWAVAALYFSPDSAIPGTKYR